MIEKKAYAKINLFLDIENLRNDGYHNIKSIMQTVDWYDTIQVEKNKTDGIKIICDDKKIPTDSSNIVFRAAKAFMNELEINEGILINIKKNIPISAGMAGGSADGAATLEALNELYSFPLTPEQLVDIGKNIGADIPFCILGGTKKISGIGEIIEDCPQIPKCYIVCAKMTDSGVSTPQAYRELDNIYCDFVGYNYNKKNYDGIISAIDEKNIDKICEHMFNIFEEAIAVEHSSVNKIKTLMKKHGAIKSMMSGSGPSVFGIFTDKERANSLCDELIKKGAKAKVCVPISK